MSKQKELVVLDKRVIAFYGKIDAAVEKGHAFGKQQAWAEACEAYQEALQTVRMAIGYCENSNKRAYLKRLKEFVGSLLGDCGRCWVHLGQTDQGIKCYQEAIAEGNQKAQDSLFVVLHKREDYKQAYPLLIANKKYETVAPIILHNYAMLLSTGEQGFKIDLNMSLLFFSLIYKSFQSGDSDIEAKLEKGYIEEKIAEIHCQLKDTQKELEWRLKAVAKGYLAAFHNYAEMLNDGEGVKPDEEEALKYHLLAAEGGHFEAMISCAIHYYKSDKITPNPEQAEFWLVRAMEVDKKADAAVLYCGLIMSFFRKAPEKMQKLKELIPLIEKFDADEAKNVRACMLANDPDADEDQVRQAADIFAELGDNGVSSAQFNLAVLYHTRPYFQSELAIPLYLEALGGGQIMARKNLFKLMIQLAKSAERDERALLALFRTFEQRYRRTLPAGLRKEDKNLVIYANLREALEQGIKGNVTEYFKTYFPNLHAKVNSEIICMSSRMTDAARTQTVSPVERIETILEMSLLPGASNRVRTCAFRRIGEIVSAVPEGFQGLLANLEAFNQLTSFIVANPLDNEAYIELAIGLAKLKIHPESRLVKHCYKKFYEYHGVNYKLENLQLTPYQSAMLLSAFSDMPVPYKAVSHSIVIAMLIVELKSDKMNAWQLLKSLQACCIIHSYHGLKGVEKNFIELIEKLLNKVLEINPNELSMVDCYQLYLCLNYLDKVKIGVTQPVRKKFQTQFQQMLEWLKDLKTTVSHSQEKVIQSLRSCRKDVFAEKLINGIYVDGFLKDVNVVLEFDGPFHFMVQLPDEDFPLLRVTRDSFHQVIIGLAMARVNYQELDALNPANQQNILALLRAKFLSVGVVLPEFIAKSKKKSTIQPMGHLK